MLQGSVGVPWQISKIGKCSTISLAIWLRVVPRLYRLVYNTGTPIEDLLIDPLHVNVYHDELAGYASINFPMEYVFLNCASPPTFILEPSFSRAAHVPYDGSLHVVSLLH